MIHLTLPMDYSEHKFAWENLDESYDLICEEIERSEAQYRVNWVLPDKSLTDTPSEMIYIPDYSGYGYDCPEHGKVYWGNEECRVKGCDWHEPIDQHNYLQHFEDRQEGEICWESFEGLNNERLKFKWINEVFKFDLAVLGDHSLIAKEILNQKWRRMEWQRKHGHWYFGLRTSRGVKCYWRKPTKEEFNTNVRYYQELIWMIEKYSNILSARQEKLRLCDARNHPDIIY